MARLRFFARRHNKATQKPARYKLSDAQHRLLSYAVVLALLIGFWLIRSYLITVVLAVVSAFLAYPIYQRLIQRFNRQGLALSLTLLSAFLVLIVPLSLFFVITINQIDQLLTQLSSSSQNFSVSEFGQSLLSSINNILDTLTNGAYQITAEQMRDKLNTLLANVASAALDLLSSSVSNIGKLTTNLILYFYIFSAVLSHHKTLLTKTRQLNPFSNDIADLYLERLGAMTKGIVGGQFVIATAQGVVSAAALYIAGIDYFAFLAMLLTVLSIIPLGAGIVTLPIGVLMILLGNIWQGIFIIVNHFVVVTNIDNVLRPSLIPKSGKLNSALTMLAVFSGIAIFGFAGILIGPLIMIVVVTTLDVYLSLASGNIKKTDGLETTGVQ